MHRYIEIINWLVGEEYHILRYFMILPVTSWKYVGKSSSYQSFELMDFT